jgi:hypothetical protein
MHLLSLWRWHCPWRSTRSSGLAPPVVVDDVTVKRANEKNDKLPFYSPPE